MPQLLFGLTLALVGGGLVCVEWAKNRDWLYNAGIGFIILGIVIYVSTLSQP